MWVVCWVCLSLLLCLCLSSSSPTSPRHWSFLGLSERDREPVDYDDDLLSSLANAAQTRTRTRTRRLGVRQRDRDIDIESESETETDIDMDIDMDSITGSLTDTVTQRFEETETNSELWNTDKRTMVLGREVQRHGTTTVAFIHGDRVFVCVDSKSTMDTHVGSRTVKKVLPITSHIVATMAGGAADCLMWIRNVATKVKMLEIEYQAKLGVASVATLLQGMLRSEKQSELSIGTMIAGWDGLKGAQLYYLDSEGSCTDGKIFCVGSGSQVAYSVLDSVDNLESIPREKAIDAALWAVKHATHRDGFSGGYINLLEVNATGVFHLQRVDCRSLRV